MLTGMGLDRQEGVKSAGRLLLLLGQGSLLLQAWEP